MWALRMILIRKGFTFMIYKKDPFIYLLFIIHSWEYVWVKNMNCKNRWRNFILYAFSLCLSRFHSSISVCNLVIMDILDTKPFLIQHMDTIDIVQAKPVYCIYWTRTKYFVQTLGHIWCFCIYFAFCDWCINYYISTHIYA